MDSLQTRVVALEDSVTRLEMQKTAALLNGYDDLFTSYQGLSDSYIAELRKPRVSLGGTIGLCLGSAGAGFIVGTLVGR